MPPSSHQFAASGPLTGTLAVPGDKSISHRAIMFAALAVGESRISGLLEGEDVLATVAAMRAMGAKIERVGDGEWRVHGVGVGGLLQPEAALDMGNSGTSARLLMGLLASHPVTATFIGDASLSRRPMERVAAPLRLLGAEINASPGGTLPAMVRGLSPAVPLTYRLPVASAQVKSAILLAGLNTPGVTRVIEPVPTRDHSERMLTAMGADIRIEIVDSERVIAIAGGKDLQPLRLAVPADPSSAAFPAVAAAIVEGSDVVLPAVCMNPTRDGLYNVLAMMGADIRRENPRDLSGEPVADLRVRAAPLHGIEVPVDCVASMVDEFPALFVAAAFASGRTVARGLHELRVKESDRIAVMARALTAIGARVEELDDGLIIEGSGGQRLAGGAMIDPQHDHRIAMSLAIAGLACEAPVTISDMSPVATSFPGFVAALESLHS